MLGNFFFLFGVIPGAPGRGIFLQVVKWNYKEIMRNGAFYQLRSHDGFILAASLPWRRLSGIGSATLNIIWNRFLGRARCF
jgi:hypothetical protein